MRKLKPSTFLYYLGRLEVVHLSGKRRSESSNRLLAESLRLLSNPLLVSIVRKRVLLELVRTLLLSFGLCVASQDADISS